MLAGRLVLAFTFSTALVHTRTQARPLRLRHDFSLFNCQSVILLIYDARRRPTMMCHGRGLSGSTFLNQHTCKSEMPKMCCYSYDLI